MITVCSTALLSVGGSYFTDYKIDESQEIKLGDIIKAKMIVYRGPQAGEKEVDLEVNEKLLQIIEQHKEQEAWEKYLEELSSKRPKLYAYKLDYLFDNLSEIMNAREEWNMHSDIRDAVDRGGYIAKHYIDEDGNEIENGDEWSDEYDEERYEREIYEYIAKMDVEDIKSFLCYDCFDWMDWEIEELEERKKHREYNEDTDSEEYKYICRLLDERPDVVLLLTEEEVEEYKAPMGSGSDIIVDGFGYLQMDVI